MERPSHETRSPDGWREWDRTNVDLTDRGVVVGSMLAPVSITTDVFAVDVAVDDCGDLNVLDAPGHVHRYDRHTGAITPRIEPDGIDDPRSLCVSSDTIYVVDGADGCVRAYSTELRQLRWVSDETFDDPVSIATDGRAVTVLTRGSAPGEGSLDRLDGGGGVTPVVTGFTSPTDLTVDRVGTHYVLDDNDDSEATVVRAIPRDEAGGGAGDGESTTVTDHRLPDRLQRATSLVAVQASELVVAVGEDGDAETSFCRWRVGRDDPESVEHVDRGCSTLAAPRGEGPTVVDGLYAVDDMRTHPAVYRLDRGGKTKRNDRTGQYDAQLVSRFDSGDRETRWHGVELDIDHRGHDTQIQLHYCGTDDGALADSGNLEKLDRVGPTYADRLREENVTSVSAVAALDPTEIAARVDVSEKVTKRWVEHARTLRADWKREAVDWQPLNEPNPTDALLEATGRYLWVKLELIGTEHTSPRVSTVRITYPRETPLQHLPAVYREAAARDPFLERFLALFSSVFTDVEASIEGMTRYMDPAAIPETDLSWLGDWMALDVDETWPEPARRELLECAPELAKQRGTREGLLEMLRIYLRHTRDRSAFRDALTRDSEAIFEIVTDGVYTASDAAQRLVEYESLRPLSGDGGLTQLLAAWSRVLAREQELFEELTDAELLTDEDTSEARTTTEQLLQDSDEGSLWYVVEYAFVLRGLTDAVAHGEISWDDVTAERDRCARSIRTTAHRHGPFLLEGPDLDCIDTAAARKPYADIVGHDRGVVVLTRAAVGSERLRTVRRIVHSQQPAHADGTVASLRPQIRLGDHSYLGVNTELSKQELVVGRSELGSGSVLDSREPFAHLDVRSTLDGDSFIS